MRKRNHCGVPIFNAREQALLHAELMSRPCHVCDAQVGFQCIVGGYEDGKSTYSANGKKMPLGQVHMGRLPAGFDSEKAVDAALARLDT